MQQWDFLFSKRGAAEAIGFFAWWALAEAPAHTLGVEAGVVRCGEERRCGELRRCGEFRF